MRKITSFFVLLFTILIIPFNCHAITKLGQTGLTFLKIGMGARPTAMGEAYTVVGDDANAIFYNPAGLCQIKSKFDISVSITDWFADISYNAFTLVMNGGNWGNIGVSVISPDYPIISGTEIASTEEGYIETGQLDVGAFSIGFCYGRQLTDKFMVGGQIKYISQHLGSTIYEEGGELYENKVSGVAYDFGTIYYPRFGGLESFGFGMYIRNFSPQLKYEDDPFQLPLTFSLGFSMDLMDFLSEESHGDNSFMIEVDALHPRDYSNRIHMGVEYSYKGFTTRIGYKFNYDEEGLTLGVGLNMGGIKFDYAYGDFGTFEMVNRISLGFSL